MISRYNNVCKKCNKRIRAGIDEIGKDSTLGWVHALCVDVSSNYKYGTADVVNPDALLQTIDSVPEQKVYVENKFTPSPYQQAIFDWIVNGTGHGVVEAVAGSGKTTTIVQALKLTPKDASVAFVAFNKHIATELQLRSPSHVRVSTLHALGLNEIRRNFGHINIDSDKLSKYFDEYWCVRRKQVSNPVRIKNRIKRSLARKVISLSKAILLDVSNPKAIEEAMDRYGIEYNSESEDVLRKIPDIMEQSKMDVNIVDFDDMIWFPATLNIELTKYDYLFVDEAQDLNKSQTQFLLKSIKPEGRIIAVGDRSQSLYGFRGADTDAIPSMIETLKATVLPLSISYRCPVSHVELAKQYVQEIEARPGAPQGEVAYITEEQFESMPADGDMILCRTNAPLISPAFKMIRSGKRACVRGRDIGASLIAMIDRFDTESINSFGANLNEYFHREYERMVDRGKELQAEMLKDQVETIELVMSECTSDAVSELRNKFSMLFSDEREAVTFSSIHRAKGLEAERVFILRPELMPHPKAKKEWEAVQESNCIYVAYTRSKQSLFIVSHL